MQKGFEPCKTKPLDYPAIFQEHIVKNLKQPGEWPKVESTFQEMSRIRSTFDWAKLTQSEHFNSPIMRTIQDNIEEYLRYPSLYPAFASSSASASSSARHQVPLQTSKLIGYFRGPKRRSTPLT